MVAQRIESKYSVKLAKNCFVDEMQHRIKRLTYGVASKARQRNSGFLEVPPLSVFKQPEIGRAHV